MSAVDETIVREYFELQGFLVCQRRKYLVQSRRQTADEEVNFIVINPAVAVGALPAEFDLTPAALGNVSRAIVAVKGWHTEIFAPGVLKRQSKFFRFVEKQSIEEAARLVGSEGLLKLLVMPGLPRGARARQQSIELLKQKGVDGVISFETILSTLAASVKINRNYVKSELLQTLRLLKNYGLLKDPQLELKFLRSGSGKRRGKA